MDLPAPPRDDADVPRWTAELGLPGLVDVHVHFLPERMLHKVWDYFDQAETHYGVPWPVHYRLPEPERYAVLERLGVLRFAPLTYPHKPGMGEWLTGWAGEFADAHPRAVRTATLYPEPSVVDYLGRAVADGARMVKVHVQVGGFDPRDPLLRDAWGAFCGLIGVSAPDMKVPLLRLVIAEIADPTGALSCCLPRICSSTATSWSTT